MARCCVVIPTYCEREHLATLLPRVFAQQERMAPHELWVLVVDDGSPDGTAAMLAKLRARFPTLRSLSGRKLGLGVAYQRGITHAIEALRADLVVQMDGDWQHDPDTLPALVAACQGPVRAVVGSRFAPGGATPTFSRRRRWMSRVGSELIHRLAGLPRLHDYTSGYRCLEARTLERVLPRCRGVNPAARGYAFQSSLITEFLLEGGAVVEVPITFGQRRYGRSKLTRRDALEFAVNLGYLRRRRMQAARSARKARTAGGGAGG